jgi:hypothetical protein
MDHSAQILEPLVKQWAVLLTMPDLTVERGPEA